MESIVYTALLEKISACNGAIISVAHRSTVRHFHTRELKIDSDGSHNIIEI